MSEGFFYNTVSEYSKTVANIKSTYIMFIEYIRHVSIDT